MWVIRKCSKVEVKSEASARRPAYKLQAYKLSYTKAPCIFATSRGIALAPRRYSSLTGSYGDPPQSVILTTQNTGN